MNSEEIEKRAVIVQLKESLLKFLGVSGNVHGYHCLNLVNQLSYVLDIEHTPINIFEQIMYRTMVDESVSKAEIVHLNSDNKKFMNLGNLT